MNVYLCAFSTPIVFTYITMSEAVLTNIEAYVVSNITDSYTKKRKGTAQR